MSQKKEIYVYAHWEKINDPFLMGTLTSVKTRGKEVFAFEYDQAWLESELNAQVDPDLLLYPGQFYTTNEKPNFGVFMDSSPDRWGRVLMNRKESILARQEKRQEKQLLESDYLLGVYDGHRMGGLRFKLDESESFLNNDLKMAAPHGLHCANLNKLASILNKMKRTMMKRCIGLIYYSLLVLL
jgi:serine/threonine-protein kinase HipA